MNPITRIFLLVFISTRLLGQDLNTDYNIVWDTIQHAPNSFGWQKGMTVPNLQMGLDNSYPDYLVITPDKKVFSIFTSGGDIGKLGVLLQEYFAENPTDERPS